jgi:hypothetical protein
LLARFGVADGVADDEEYRHKHTRDDDCLDAVAHGAPSPPSIAGRTSPVWRLIRFRFVAAAFVPAALRSVR